MLEFTPSFLWYFDAVPRNDGIWWPPADRRCRVR